MMKTQNDRAAQRKELADLQGSLEAILNSAAQDIPKVEIVRATQMALLYCAVRALLALLPRVDDLCERMDSYEDAE